jgi:hypothetical protein
MGLVGGKEKNCPLKKCGKPIDWDEPLDQRFGRLRCLRQKCPNRNKRTFSCTAGSWFEDVHFPTDQAIVLMYSFTCQMTYEMAINECKLSFSTPSSQTIAYWYTRLREIMVKAMDLKYQSDGPMGDEGHVIEIDESLIGKQKNHVSRLPPGTWVFGMYNRNTKELRMIRCPGNKCDSATLIPLITGNIKKGSKIISDRWGVYYDNHNKISKLVSLILDDEELEYDHDTVNHKENFVDPDTGANTQTIECYWRHLKTDEERWHPI